MNTLAFISKYLSAPPVPWRSSAYTALYKSALVDDKAIKQLKQNLRSDNLDIVENSLKVLLSLSQKTPVRVLSLKTDICNTAQRCRHFKIAYFAKNILADLVKIDASVNKELYKVINLITPKIFISTRREETYYRSYSCEHGVEYTLGDESYKYRLSEICNAFEYDCKKALKKVLQIMRGMGYKKDTHYWKAVPPRWRRNYYRDENGYKTKLHYCSHHSIQIFLIWCINNLPLTKESWDSFLREQKNFDPSFVNQKISDRPSFIKFVDLNLDAKVWLKQKIKREDVFNSVKLSNPWVVLYENTYIRYEDKVFDRDISTCFSKTSLKSVKKKKEVFAPYYDCRNTGINEVPTIANQSKKLSVYGHNSEEIERKISPSHGTISETNFETTFNPIFPAPDLVDFLKLKQRKGTLEYYKGKELVVHCINWQNGYIANSGRSGEDKFQIVDHGTVLIIKSKYLKSFLKARKLRLISTGEITKRKIDKYGTGWDYKVEDTKRKRFAFEVSKPL